MQTFVKFYKGLSENFVLGMERKNVVFFKLRIPVPIQISSVFCSLRKSNGGHALKRVHKACGCFQSRAEGLISEWMMLQP